MKKSRENKKEQVEAEARALAKERLSTGESSKPTGQASLEQPKTGG